MGQQQELQQILIVDDDAFNRDGLSLFLRKSGFCVLEAGDVNSAYQMAKDNHPIAAIVDIVIPYEDRSSTNKLKDGGLLLAKKLKQLDPVIGIVFFSAFEDRGNYVWDLMQEGWRGIVYKLKGIHPEELIHAIQDSIDGKVSFDPEILLQTASLTHELRTQLSEKERPWVEKTISHFGELTNREMEIARRLAASHNTQGISHSLKIAPKTVENHINRIYQKLDLQLLPQKNPHLRKSMILAKAFMIKELMDSEF